jgi:hypothetical protein
VVCSFALAATPETVMFAAQKAPEASEYEIKAAYIYNFIAFTHWPAGTFASAATPLRVCVVGDDPFGSTLDRTIHGEVVNDRRMVVERVAPAGDVGQCNVVFVSRRTAAPRILDALAMAPVLTVGESVAFADAGGLIAFVVDAGRVRFEVNRTLAERRRLSFSARLLAVARRVR